MLTTSTSTNTSTSTSISTSISTSTGTSTSTSMLPDAIYFSKTGMLSTRSTLHVLAEPDFNKQNRSWTNIY